MSDGALAIRAAAPADVQAVHGLIRELADYEKLAHAVVASEGDLHDALFGARPCAESLVAEAAGRVVGFALFFTSYSTFVGRPGIYLEDLYVQPAARGRGIGKALLARLAAIAVERRCGRLEWSVLDWNAPAIGFYRSLGAQPMDEWTVYRLDGDALRALGRTGIA